MSDNYENNNGRWTKEQIRDFEERELRTKRAEALVDFYGIARDPDQDEWKKEQRNLQNRRADPSNFHETFVRLILKFEPNARVVLILFNLIRADRIRVTFSSNRHGSTAQQPMR